MKLEDILHLPHFILPSSNNSNTSFTDFYKSQTSEFLSTISSSNDLLQDLEKIPIDKEIFIKDIEKSTNSIIELIELKEANKLENEQKIDTLAESLFGRLSGFLLRYALRVDLNTIFYRSKSVEPVSEHDIPVRDKRFFFHTSFEESKLVNPTRFSYKGFPSLYLSNSVFSTFIESRTINLDNFQVVKFCNKLPANFLNMSFDLPPEELKKSNPIEYQRRIFHIGNLYPLLLSCFTKNNTAGVNPPEYYIPQVLNKYLRKLNAFDGLVFQSTRIDKNKNKEKFINYILPPAVLKDIGYCEYLKDELFKMSEVCSWLHHKDNINSYYDSEYVRSYVINPDIKSIEWPIGEQIKEYCDTELGKTEYFMQKKMNAADIDF